MVERTNDFNNSYGPWETRSGDVYYVKTDEDYSLQYGDRTIEVYGDVDLIFDGLKVEGYAVWVIRHQDHSGAKLTGYTYSEGRWVEVP